MQTSHDVYKGKKFSSNEEQRYMLKFSKKDKITDLLTKLRKRKVSFPINLYRVRYDSK